MSNNLINEIKEKLVNEVCNINLTIQKEEIDTNVGLLKKNIIDSHGFVELVIFIEEQFNLKLNKDEINDKNFASINAISKFIYSKAKK